MLDKLNQMCAKHRRVEGINFCDFTKNQLTRDGDVNTNAMQILQNIL